MSVSADGYIAKLDGNSDWVSPIDCSLFEKRMQEAGSVIVGRKTFDQYSGSLYPVRNITNIVLSKNKKTNPAEQKVFYVNTPEQAVKIAKSLGCKTVILAGGGHTNGSFLNSGLIDEIFLSVHPLILGGGLNVFESVIKGCKLKLLDTREMGDGLVELHYKVISSK